MEYKYVLLFIGTILTILMGSFILSAHETDKRTTRYELCIKYHTPKECKE